MMSLHCRKIFIASKPVDFRQSIKGLSSFIETIGNNYLHDGAVYVFFNKNQDKIKCLFWDKNGMVMYYKRLSEGQFKVKKMLGEMNSLSSEDLELLLSGMTRAPLALDNQ